MADDGADPVDSMFRSLPSLEVSAAGSPPAHTTDQAAPATLGAKQFIGTILLGRYRIVESLGEGGMGAVYLAEHVVIGRKFAVKVLKLESSRSPEKAKERFLREAKVIAAIEHDHVVQISDFGTVEGRPFFVLEYLEGQDLALLMLSEGRQPWPRVKELAAQICRALRAAHAAGVIHRDLKPENCFLVARANGGDFVKLLDFGIAMILKGDALDPAVNDELRLTRTGEVLGTAAYMSPEQARGQPLDSRTDLYSLGVMLYELLAGVRPFEGTALGMMTKHAYEEPRPPSEAAPDAGITPALDALILKLLAKDPDERYPSASALLEAIELISVRVLDRPNLAGVVLHGCYKLIERVGEGGMGTVYLARHTTIERRCAVKILHAEYVRLYKGRFLQEAKAASSINHPNVVRITDYGEMYTGQPFLVMDFLSGERLSDTIAREGRLPWRRVKCLIAQVCNALQAAHDVGVVHRDVKPDNCQRFDTEEEHDIIKVLDFGIAKVITGGPKLTATGEIFGTAAYMSPEQAVGDTSIDHRTDIYSTGVMMFEMLAGVRPFQGSDNNGLVYQHVHTAPPRLETFVSENELPPEAAEIVHKALRKNPGDRHASMREMHDAIMQVPDVPGVDSSHVTQKYSAPAAGAPSHEERPSSGSTVVAGVAATPSPDPAIQSMVNEEPSRWVIPVFGGFVIIAVSILIVGMVIHEDPAPGEPATKADVLVPSASPTEQKSAKDVELTKTLAEVGTTETGETGTTETGETETGETETTTETTETTETTTETGEAGAVEGVAMEAKRVPSKSKKKKQTYSRLPTRGQ